MKVKFRSALAGLLALVVSSTTAPAALLTYSGNQTDVGPGWRTAAVAKPLDIDGDNVLGTDGYQVVNRPATLPGYVSAMTILSSTYPGNASYASMDDPLNPPNQFLTGTMNPSPGTGASANLFNFVLNGNATNRTIRVGLLIDNLNSANWNAASLSLVQTNGAGATNGPIVNSPSVLNDRVPDWIFFQIAGASAGDTFVIRGTGGINGTATLGGVAFDSKINLVTTTASSGPGSLPAVVASALPNTSITFDPSLSGQTITLTNGEVPLNQNLTIDGSALTNGVTLSGGNSNRVFNIGSGANVKLVGLTLTKCIAADAGGAIYSAPGTVLTISRCTFTGNSALEGGAILNDGTMQVENSTFSGNTAAYGGAIQCRNLTSLTSCTISSNNAPQGGGGVFNKYFTLTNNNSIIAGNTPVTSGDIYSQLAALVFTGTNLIQNIILDRPTAANSGSLPLTNEPNLSPLGNYGGPTQTMPPLPGSPAIDTGGPTTLATDQRGFPRVAGPAPDIGAVEGALSPVLTTADSGYGSLRYAIAYATAGATITFAPNLSGASILLTNGELLLNYNVTLDGSALPGGIILSGNHTNRVIEAANGAAITLKSLSVSNGYADGGNGGGGILCHGTLTLNNVSVVGNYATFGGGIYQDSGLLVVSNSLVANNASYDCGGIYNWAGSNALFNCTITGNSATNGSDPGGFGAKSGGGFKIYVGNATIVNTTIAGNTAADFGGGINNFGGTLALTNTIVARNVAPVSTNIAGVFSSSHNLIDQEPLLAPLGSYGGPTQTMPPLFGSPVIDAGGPTALSTDQRGYARVVGPAPDIGAVEFEASSVITTTNDSGFGSLRYAVTYTTNGQIITFAPSLSGQTITLTNGELLLNKSLAIDAVGLTNGITLNGNFTNRIFEVAVQSTVVLNSLTFSNGFTSANGGAIWNQGTLMVNRCTFAGNYAGFCGGALFAGSNSVTWLTNSTFVGNSVGKGGNGNAVANGNFANAAGDSSVMTISQCTFEGNVPAAMNLNSALWGGAVANCGTSLVLDQSSLIANTADNGGGLFNFFGSTTVHNSIIADNLAGSGKDAEANFTNNPIRSGGFNLIGKTTGGNGFTNGIGGDLVGTSLAPIEPLLAPLGSHGGPTQTMPPLPDSPAVNTGGPTALFTDQRGFPRVVGPAPDIGAVEFQDASSLVTTTNDSGFGSLRYAVTYTTNGQVITFDPSLSGQTITLASGELLLNKSLTIDSLGLANGLTLNGNHTSRIFEVTAPNTVVLNSLTLSNGFTTANGGAIDNFSVLTLNECTLVNNTAQGSFGGAINNNSETIFTANQCTFFHNSSGNRGGAIESINSGNQLFLRDCTIVSNTAAGGGNGGGIRFYGTMTLENCLIAQNTAANDPDVSFGVAAYESEFNNLIGDGTDSSLTNGVNGDLVGSHATPLNPQLATLGNYGGPTQTMPPLIGSPALDAGGDSVTNFLTTDQRGLARRAGGQVDIGAVEFQTSPLVTNNNDSGPGSLRLAAGFTTNNANITFLPGLSGQTILLTSGQITLNHDLTIDGSALPGGILINGNSSSRIFYVNSGVTVMLNSLVITNGNAIGDSGGGISDNGFLTVNNSTIAGNFAGDSLNGGGGILALSPGSVTLNNSTITGNSTSGNGGGLFMGCPVIMNNCTVVGNSAVGGSFGGGGIFILDMLTMNNCTISGNSSPLQAGGISFFVGTLNFTNCIVAGNTASNGADLLNFFGYPLNGLNNLTNGNPQLAPLGNYGGPTPTMPLLPGSPAIDAGVATSLTTDQRGFPRPLGLGPDIGAVEGVYNFAGVGQLTGIMRLSNGFIRFGFTNYTDTSFTVFASTNLTLPFSAWSNLGAAVESPVGSGQFLFTDSQATNNPQRFYRVRSP